MKARGERTAELRSAVLSMLLGIGGAFGAVGIVTRFPGEGAPIWAVGLFVLCFMVAFLGIGYGLGSVERSRRHR